MDETYDADMTTTAAAMAKTAAVKLKSRRCCGSDRHSVKEGDIPTIGTQMFGLVLLNDAKRKGRKKNKN